MTGKKGLLVLMFLIFILPLVLGQSKVEISLVKEDYVPGENVTFRVNVYDSDNNLVDGRVLVEVEDAENNVRVEKEVNSNQIISVGFGENPVAGLWKITASYDNVKDVAFPYIKEEERASFRIDGDELIVTNVGNVEYSKKIQIIIGENLGSKDLELGVGGEIRFRLVAPDGVYNVRVTDGETSLTKGNVALTGEAIGILDERVKDRSGITGVNPEENILGSNLLSGKSIFLYVFLVVILASAILLGIERYFRKRGQS